MAEILQKVNWGLAQTIIQLFIVPLLVWLLKTTKDYVDKKFDAAAKDGVRELAVDNTFCQNIASRVVNEINGKLMYAKHAEQASINDRFRQNFTQAELERKEIKEVLQAHVELQAKLHTENTIRLESIIHEIRPGKSRRQPRIAI